MAGPHFVRCFLILTVVTAGCSSVKEQAAISAASTSAADPSISPGPPISAGARGAALLPDVEGLVLPDGWPAGIPAPENGALQASSVDHRADGTRVNVAGPEDQRWVLYAVPGGEVVTVATLYRQRLGSAGFKLSASNQPESGIEQFDVESQPATIARLTQTASGVIVVVAIRSRTS